MTTTGSFRTDSEGYLRTSTGVTLLGWPANADGTIPSFPRDTGAGLQPVRVNVNQFTSEPTHAHLAGGQSAWYGHQPGRGWHGAKHSRSSTSTNLGTSQSINVTFTPTVPAAPPASNTWTMTMTDSASGGSMVGEYTVVFRRFAGGRGHDREQSTQAPGAPGGAYDPRERCVDGQRGQRARSTSISAMPEPVPA